jgi:hypothetical protein
MPKGQNQGPVCAPGEGVVEPPFPRGAFGESKHHSLAAIAAGQMGYIKAVIEAMVQPAKHGSSPEKTFPLREARSHKTSPPQEERQEFFTQP